MTTKQLNKGNILIKKMDSLRDIIDDYNKTIRSLDDIEDLKDSTRIYNNNKSFECTYEQYKEFLSSLLNTAEAKNEELFSQFKEL